MRKWLHPHPRSTRIVSLQCGRIYKDAEIRQKAQNTTCRIPTLQCGRIYKDAEMSLCPIALCCAWGDLQCGRIYKDAEMQYLPKMYSGDLFLQCGRIYKDAEISTDVIRDRLNCIPSMWPHL